MFFNNCQSVEEIKGVYRKLCMQHHPDRGGNTETMQEINQQYKEALKAANGQTMTGTDGAEHTYHYDADIEQAVMDKISELLALNMNAVEIALIGTWIWILGNTKPFKAELGKKGLGCYWHAKRKCWYWHEGKYRSRSADCDLSEIAKKYGFKTFKQENTQAVLSH